LSSTDFSGEINWALITFDEVAKCFDETQGQSIGNPKSEREQEQSFAEATVRCAADWTKERWVIRKDQNMDEYRYIDESGESMKWEPATVEDGLDVAAMIG
jgi:hypothetical protein